MGSCPPYGYGVLRGGFQSRHQFRRSGGKSVHLGRILGIGSPLPQHPGEGMLSHKGSGCDGVQAVCNQDIAQLHEGVIIVSVAEEHYRHGQRAAAHHFFL